MKKIFIPALLFLFVSSVALAETTFTFGGSYEFGGRYILNNSLGNDDKLVTKTVGADTVVDKTRKENAAYNFQYLEFDISASVDSFALYVHANPFDRFIGQLDTTDTNGAPLAVGGETLNGEYIDRAFATYAVLPNLVFVGGRVLAGGVLADGAAPFAGGYEYLGFGSGAYNTLFSERVNGDGLGVIFVANDNLNFTFVNERYVEADGSLDVEPTDGSSSYTGGGVDYDGYILKANFSTGDIVVKPYISWVSLPKNATIIAPTSGEGTSLTLDESAHALAFYVGGGYNPASGISVNAAAGLNYIVDGVVDTTILGAGTTVDAADIPPSFGGYLNVAFAQDIFKVGLEAAYASYKYEEASVKNGTVGQKVGLQGFYQFGGDFDRTYVVDGLLGGTGSGIPAMTTIQLYAAITPIEKLTIAPRVAYYLSNVNKKEGSVRIGADLLNLVSDSRVAIGEDTTFLEVDLIAQYAWTESTTAYAGLVYVQADKVDVVDISGISGYDKYSPDPSFGVAWGLISSF